MWSSYIRRSSRLYTSKYECDRCISAFTVYLRIGRSSDLWRSRYLRLQPRPSSKVLTSDNLAVLPAATVKLQCNTFERRNQCTSGGADECREPSCMRVYMTTNPCIQSRLSIQTISRPALYSCLSRRTGSYRLSPRAYINYWSLRRTIVPSLIEDRVNIDRMLAAIARIVIKARNVISNRITRKRY